MQEVNCYYIVVTGPVEEKAFNAISPLWIKVELNNAESTRFSVSTDQSGLIGLLRFLHQRGFVLLSVCRAEIKSI